MKKLLTLLPAVLLLTITHSFAQSWQWVARNTYPAFVASIESSQLAVDNSGNVYTSGSALEYHVGVLAGLKSAFGNSTIIDSTAVGQMIIAKVDSTGSFQWAKGTQQTDAAALGMVTDKAGNLYVLGIYDDEVCSIGGMSIHNATGEEMYFLMKFTPAGAVSWMKNVVPTYAIVVANEISARGGIGIDSSDNLYIGGTFYETTTLGPFTLTNPINQDDMFLAKYNTSGTPLWAQSYQNYQDDFEAMAVNRNGDIFVAGSFGNSSITFGTTTINNNPSSQGNYLAKFDGNGNPKWAKSADDVLPQLNGVATDTLDNVYMTGGFRNSPTHFGSFTVTNVSPGTDDAFLVKYDSLGVVQWAHSAGTVGSDDGLAVTADKCGNVWMCGSMDHVSTGGINASYTMNFGTGTLAGMGSLLDDNLFVARYNAAGIYQSSQRIASGGDDAAGMQVDNHGSFYIAGDWYQTTDTLGSSIMSPDSGAEYLYLGKYFYDTEHCLPQYEAVPQAIAANAAFTLFPNPASDEVTVVCTAIDDNTHVQLCDINGRVVRSIILTAQRTVISLKGLPDGIYICKCSSHNATITQKLVIKSKG